MIPAEPGLPCNQPRALQLFPVTFNQGDPECPTRIRTRASRTRTRARNLDSSRAAARSQDSNSKIRTDSKIRTVRARNLTSKARAAVSSKPEFERKQEGPAARRDFFLRLRGTSHRHGRASTRPSIFLTRVPAKKDGHPSQAGRSQLGFNCQTAAATASRSRRMVSREVFLYLPPSPNRGRRECRAPDAPDSRACNDSGRTHTR
jgi:hypothetical protein